MGFQPIRGHERYSINKEGVIKNEQGKVMKQRHDKYGYARINLQKDGEKKTEKVHRLVMVTFNPVPNASNMTIDHIDGNKSNNHISNLRWAYLGENLNLQHLQNTDELLYLLGELRDLYPKEELAEIMKNILNIARILKK